MTWPEFKNILTNGVNVSTQITIGVVDLSLVIVHPGAVASTCQATNGWHENQRVQDNLLEEVHCVPISRFVMSVQAVAKFVRAMIAPS